MSIDWDGKGLPPIGLEIEHQCFGCAGWTKATVIAYGAKKTFYSDGHGHEWSRLSDELKFRPIPDIERMKAAQRKRAIEQTIADLRLTNGNGWYSIAEDLYDRGYRKFEIVEEDV